MAARLALLILATTLLLSAAADGGSTNCPSPPMTPTPTTPQPPPSDGGGGGNGSAGSCPIDALKLELNIGVPDDEQCCPLLQGLADLDAAVGLCLAIRANILGIVLNVPIDLTLLLNYCHKDRVASFTCPA
ncbi:Cortical cell-delineating protein [Zea mays]|uniref:Cortical cell-delineating protein n=1 Tax=Zea mays TaxID=4577 RepID=A0A317YAU1_MAIZE|nr:Cortical cell-delineating protein [Zea mays]